MTRTAFVLTATAVTRDAAHALVTSIAQHHPDCDVVVIVSHDAEFDHPSAHSELATGLVDSGLLMEQLFHPEDVVAFAVPFAIRSLLQGKAERVIYVRTGCLVVNPLDEMIDLLESCSFVVGSQARLVDSTVTSIELSGLRKPSEIASAQVWGFTSAAVSGPLAFLESLMAECVSDGFLRRPSDLLVSAVPELVASWSPALASSQSLASLPTYLTGSLRSVGPQPAVVTCEAVWDLIRSELDGSLTADELEGAQAALLSSFDLGQSVEFDELAELARAASMKSPQNRWLNVPFRWFVRDLRRAADPHGIRWPVGQESEFEEWLFAVDRRGLTRASEMYFHSRDDLVNAMPWPKVDPTRYLTWLSERAWMEFGMNPQDPQARPEHPEIAPVPVDVDDSGPRVRHAFRWRLTMVRQIFMIDRIIDGFRTSFRPLAPLALVLVLVVSLAIGLMTGAYWPWLAVASLSGVVLAVIAIRATGRFRHVRLHHPTPVVVEPMVDFRGESEPAVTVMGMFRSNTGLGEAARATVRAMLERGKPFSYFDTTDQFPIRNGSCPELSEVPAGAYGDVNLVHAQPVDLASRLPIFTHRLAGRYNIGFWFWESTRLPEAWMPAFDVVDELWVSSDYLVDVFGQYGRVPVRNVGLATKLPHVGSSTRASFGLSESEFVYLFVYDAHSVSERKNPAQALEAFADAFPNEGSDAARFVLKTSNLHRYPEQEDRLQELARSHPHITIIDEYIPRQTLIDLIALSDVYVSLHASEGYGLTLLEAMALGTPVICTAYSGNMDFTSHENSWLVDYELVALDRAFGPYQKGTVWASPLHDSAVSALRSAYDEPDLYKEKAALCSATAVENASVSRYASNLNREFERLGL